MNFHEMSDAELRSINQQICAILKSRSRAKCAQAAAQFCIGDKAFFIKDGRRFDGTVQSVGPKNVKVRVDHTLWTVASTLLSKVS